MQDWLTRAFLPLPLSRFPCPPHPLLSPTLPLHAPSSLLPCSSRPSPSPWSTETASVLLYIHFLRFSCHTVQGFINATTAPVFLSQVDVNQHVREVILEPLPPGTDPLATRSPLHRHVEEALRHGLPDDRPPWEVGASLHVSLPLEQGG